MNIIITITHKRTDAQGTILELKDDRNVIYNPGQIITMLQDDVPIKIHSKEILSAEDLKKDIFNDLPEFYYRDQKLRPCEYL